MPKPKRVEKIIVLEGRAKEILERAASRRVNGPTGVTASVRTPKERDDLRNLSFL